jgi:hypothetical protein
MSPFQLVTTSFRCPGSVPRYARRQMSQRAESRGGVGLRMYLPEIFHAAVPISFSSPASKALEPLRGKAPGLPGVN